MLEHLESRITLQEEPNSLQELQHVNSMGEIRYPQSIDHMIRTKLRSIEKNLGNLSRNRAELFSRCT